MAGAGYKLFNTGDVLTAAQVNTYLMEQTVMVFADAAARTTALTGVVAEGMLSYLKDTNAVEKYTGSAWVSIDTGSTSPLTTKGDLYTYSTTDARLAVGNNGDTLVADSAESVGLRWSQNFAAGKNKIINGDFNIWQRGTSFTVNSTAAYTADRWIIDSGASQTVTVTRQAFTPGAAPVAGYEGSYYLRLAYGGANSTTACRQYIENVQTLAGQTATLSFWAKVSSGTVSVTPRFVQNFGSGGSSAVVTNASAVTFTTSWQRFSVTVNVPSISGKTIGTSSSLHIDFSLSPNSLTFDIWGVQVEAGSVATAFQTATGTLQGELAACQRYYWRISGSGYARFTEFTPAGSATLVYTQMRNPVVMRVKPTAIDFANLAWWDNSSVGNAVTALTINGDSNPYLSFLTVTTTGMTQYRNYQLMANNTDGYIGLSAEL